MGQITSISSRERPSVIIRSGLHVTERQIANTLGIVNISSIETEGPVSQIKSPFQIEPRPKLVDNTQDLESPMSAAIRRLNFVDQTGTGRSENIACGYFALNSGEQTVTVVQPRIRQTGETVIYTLRNTGVEYSVITEALQGKLGEAALRANRAMYVLAARYLVAKDAGYISG